MDELIKEGVKVDCLVTDPPYKITSRGHAGSSGGMMLKEKSLKGDIFEHNNCDIDLWLPKAKQLLKDDSHIYIMTNHVNLHHYLNIIQKNGIIFTKCLIWDKGNKIMGQYYMNQFEYILFCRMPIAKKINKCGTSDLISVPNTKTQSSNNTNLHDTEKPVRLMEILISNSTNKNDIVLEPFMGVGSTGIACKNLKRDFIGVEIDKTYFNIASDRIKKTSESLF